MPEIDIKDYENRCKEILDDEEVRFAGLLDELTTNASHMEQGANQSGCCEKGRRPHPTVHQ